MKKIKLTNGLLALTTLFLFNSVVLAEDFEPQVLYQDQEYIDSHGGSSASSASSSSSSASSDSGSDFEPVVLYQDKDYIAEHSSAPKASSLKPVASTVKSAPKASSSSSSSSEAASTSAEAKPAKEGTPTAMYLIGILAVAGVAYMMTKGGGSSAAAAGENVVYGKDPSGKSGVERYLASVGGASGAVTGVAKYLEQHASSVASSAQTGVARYLQNKG